MEKLWNINMLPATANANTATFAFKGYEKKTTTFFLEFLECVCCTAVMTQLKPTHTEEILALRDKSLWQEAVWRTKKQSNKRRRDRKRCVCVWLERCSSTEICHESDSEATTWFFFCGFVISWSHRLASTGAENRLHLPLISHFKI